MVLAVLVLSAIPDLIVDYWFFQSVGQARVFWTMLGAQLALFGITWLVFCLADYLPIRQYAVSPALRNAAIHLGSWSGLFAGWVVSKHWTTLLLWRHQQTFGVTDPVFGHDIGFYVFALPALTALLRHPGRGRPRHGGRVSRSAAGINCESAASSPAATFRSGTRPACSSRPA